MSKNKIILLITMGISIVMATGCFGNIDAYQPLSKAKGEKIISKGEK